MTDQQLAGGTSPTPAPAPNPGGVSASSTWPNSIELVKAGFGIYKQEWKTIVPICLVGLVAGFVLSVPFLVLIAYVHQILILGATFVIALLIFIYLYVWMYLAIAHAIQARDARISVKEAFMRARPQIFALIWIDLLQCFIAGGVVGLGLLVPGFIVGILYAFLHDSLAVSGASGVLIGGLIFLIFIVIFFTIALYLVAWFFFVIWLLVEDNKRGFAALIESRHLARHHISALIWRLAFVTIIIGLIGIVLDIPVLIYAFASTPFGAVAKASTVTNVVQQLYQDLINFFILTPVSLGAFYTLFEAFKKNNDVPPGTPVVDKATDLKTYAVIGFIAILLLLSIFAIAGFIAASAHFSHS